MRTLVLGIGNPILRDDGIGYHAAKAIERMDIEGVDANAVSTSGLDIINFISGYDKVVVIDAIQTKNGKVGRIYRLKEEDISSTVNDTSPHAVNIAAALSTARRLEYDKMPKEIIFFAVEVQEINTFGEEMTPEVKKALPKIVKLVLSEIE